MRSPSLAAVPVLVASAALACGDAAAPIGGLPALRAVNGAVHPRVQPGEVAGWSGFGFGASQGEGAVLVTTAGGLVAAEVIDWSDGGITARLPDDVVSGATWVVAGPDTLGPLALLVQAPTPFDPASRQWSEGPALPESRTGAAAAALHYPVETGLSARVVLFGGRRTDGTLSDATHLATADAEGRITAWTAAPDTVVPSGRVDHALAAADRTNAPLEIEGVAYLIGGRDPTDALLSSVQGLAVGAGGEYGLWTPLTSLPGVRAGAAAIVAFGNLFVVGGFGADSLASRDVRYTAVNPDGTLTGWFTGPSLPEGLAYAALAVAGQTLYVVGGQRGAVDPAGVGDTASLGGAVYAIPLSRTTGFFQDSMWVATPSALLHPRARHAAFALDGALVVVGGVYAGMPGAGESEFAPLDADGSVQAFQELPAPTLAALAGAPAWAFAAPRLRSRTGNARATVLGGATAAGPTNRTWTQ